MPLRSLSNFADVTVPSVRLQQVLRTYCRNLDPSGIADLRLSLADGRYRWLHDELATALASSVSATSWWQESVSDPTAEVRSVLDEQRYLWRSLFPGEAVPRRA
ncbi:hypothetical protein [Cryptosporangium phraense]|uniref:Uncharacterized protein n=1 Tax=Cryptosporangium phraense TaxID=2593070 RepID=A0A545AKP7_9ACTN|nr:hypothetical protein [Cryptosporangium phraense]TQS41879.1 hypothetical protein FL583_26710 [Cryptosporangium phraense]